MTTAGDIFEFLNSIADFASQADWDNSGFLVGDARRPVSKIAVTLYIDLPAVQTAVETGADLIVSHHPVIFYPLKELTAGKPAYELVQSGIAAICAHTCLDMAPGGVNDILASLLGLENIETLMSGEAPGVVRTGTRRFDSAERLAGHIAAALGAQAVYADAGKPIDKIAVCGGSGGSYFKDAIEAGMDALVTGEASHHEFLEAADAGLSLFAAGHFETEFPVVPVLAARLRERFPQLRVDIIGARSRILRFPAQR